jgi:predicted outer membrane protein
MKKNMVSRCLSAGLAVLVLGAAGCATRDTVSSRFPQVEENINAAKTAGAEVYAPDPLRSAEAKLEAAKSAVRGNDMVAASSLVDQAMVDADYARAKAPTEKAKNEAVQLRTAILALRADIRNIPVAK